MSLTISPFSVNDNKSLPHIPLLGLEMETANTMNQVLNSHTPYCKQPDPFHARSKSKSKFPPALPHPARGRGHGESAVFGIQVST